MLFNRAKTEMVAPERALKGRDHYEFAIPQTHYVKGTPLQPPFPEGMQTIVFGLGCFWGAEEIFWQTPGVYTTAVGYAGGYTEHPSYEEVCTGLTGHTEAVLVVYDPSIVSIEELTAIFFEVHDPTQGNRQGNDIGSQYRSAVYFTDDHQREVAEKAKVAYSAVIEPRGYPKTTTEIAPLNLQRDFFYAEGYHQQYLAKNPNGYRCHAATDIPFPREALA